MTNEQANGPAAPMLQRVAATLAGPGADLWRRCVQEIAGILDVRIVFAGEITLPRAIGLSRGGAAQAGASRGRIDTLAIWRDNEFAPNAEYFIDGTAAAEAASGRTVHHASGVAELFPLDRSLGDAGAESYVGVPLLDIDGEAIGILALVDDKPMPAAADAIAVLQIFAGRMAGEIERRRAERALTESEIRYRLLIEDSFDLVAELDGQRYSYVSQKYADVLGYASEELLGANLFELIHPDDRRSVQTESQEMIAAHRAGTFLFRMQHHDATWRWIEAIARAFPIPGGYHTTVFSRDVTERHARQDALYESEARFRSLIDDLHVGVIVRNANSEVMTFNQAALSLLGVTASELLGTTSFDPTWDTLREDGSPCATEDQPWRIAIATKRPVRGVTLGVARPAKGDRIWLLVSAEPRLTQAGDVEQVVVTMVDVTASVLSHAELRETEATARALLNAPTQAAVLVDREGGILALNMTAAAGFSAHAKQHGLDVSGGFVGLCVFDLMPWELRAERRGRHEQVLLTGVRATYEDERDGTWTDNTIDPILDATGAVIRLAIFSRDITDRKRDEEKLRAHAVELEQLNEHLASTMDDLARSQRELSEKSAQMEQLLAAEREHSRLDALTGTLNHGAITELLRDQLDSHPRCAAAVVDVDGMKAVNDTFGHQSGDALLRAVAGALRHPGAVVGRYGGDEFLVVLPDADGEAVRAYEAAVGAALLATRVSDPETGATVPVVASIGTAVYPEDGDTLSRLVEVADEAMYREKRQRRDTSAPSLSTTRSIGDESAARIVGELVPLLTSAGTVDAKLRLVAHHLSVDRGYAGVSFDVFDAVAGRSLAQNTFAKVPQEKLEAWRAEQQGAEEGPVGRLLAETHKPVIIDDIEHDEMVAESQRALLLSVGIRSGIVVPLLWQNEVIGSMSVGSKQLAGFDQRDAHFMMAVAAQVTAIIRLAELVDRLEDSSARLSTSRDEMVMVLGAAAEQHSRSGGEHLRSVRQLSEALATEMGHGVEDAYELGLAAALHDIGKLRVPDELLSSAIVLDPVDFEMSQSLDLLRQHCIWGAELLAGASGLQLAAEVAHSHHERWDGTGYPDGLAAGAIPEAATIVAVADSFDAMVCGRRYQRGVTEEAAVNEIIRCRGTQFSPAAVDALVRLQERGALAALLAHTGLDAAA